MKSLILIRGIPGSSKSTIAKQLSMGNDIFHVEADQYFVDEYGVYQFDQSRLHTAHLWCQDKVNHHLGLGREVICSNTFTTKKELSPYFEIARKHGIRPNVITCQGNFKNIHNVPEEVLVKMKARFDYNCVDNLYKEYFND